MQPEQVSLRAVLLGVASFVIVTLVMIVVIERIGIERIQAFVEGAGPLAPLAYIALKAATYVFAPLSAGPVQLVSGAIFGLFWGTLYTLIGEVLGGSINFWIGRRLGRPVVTRFVGAQGLARVDRFSQQLGGWRALAYARLTLFAVYDFISYAAGLTTTIRFVHYVLVSALLGVIPTFLFVAVGASLADNPDVLPLIYVGVGLLSVLPFAVRYLTTRASNREKGKR
jgi:uncharacterized membrane protein YdjX (TVP38/TMEM64 family)